MKPFAFLTPTVTAPAVVGPIGCNNNERVARVAMQAADRQAEQNQEMARLDREVTEGTKRLVEADAEARKDVLAMQKDLQDQASEVGQQRDLLESERRQIAQHQLRESMLGPIIANLAPLLVCASVLVFCGLLVYGLRSDKGDDDNVVAEVLIEELASAEPQLLPPLSTNHAAVVTSKSAPKLLTATDGLHEKQSAVGLGGEDNPDPGESFTPSEEESA